jgi:hypothetical protein
MRELLSRFKLPTVAAEVVRRLTDAGHDAALSTLLEVFEAEADERAQRRTERLRRTSRLPADKTFETIERDRLPRPVLAKLDELATGEFLERSDNVLFASACPGVERRTPPGPSGTLWYGADTRSSSRQHSGSSRSCSRPSVTSHCRVPCTSSMPSSCSSSTTSGTCSRAPRRWRSSSR